MLVPSSAFLANLKSDGSSHPCGSILDSFPIKAAVANAVKLGVTGDELLPELAAMDDDW